MKRKSRHTRFQLVLRFLRLGFSDAINLFHPNYKRLYKWWQILLILILLLLFSTLLKIVI